MDFMEKIVDLRSQKKKLADQAAKLVEEGKLEESGKLADQMEALNRDIQSVERLLDAARQNAQPLDGQGEYDGVLHGEMPDNSGKSKENSFTPFSSLGEQLKAIYSFRKGGVRDERLEKINAAAGVNGTTGADGGFLLQEDFAGRIMDSAVQSSPLLNRLDRYTCSNDANAMR